jgi:TPR repeat protein
MTLAEGSTMSFLPRFRSARDRDIEALERRISALQKALNSSSESARRGTRLRRGLTAVGAVFILIVGFALGVHRESFTQTTLNLARAIGLATPARKADEPLAAYQNGDYVTALRLAQVLAGDEGDARAQSLLGLIYYHGLGVPRDYVGAAKWFRLAADQGDGEAQYYLGVMLSDGQGLPQDYAEGAKWFRRAADQGDPQAQYNLGVFYANGQVGKPDNVDAYMWFNLAASHFAASDPRRNTAIRGRDLVANLMTAEQIAEAQRRARDWRPA